MNISVNPFQQLYFSDDIQSETSFVELFSAEVLQTAIDPVFQEGNVILSGPQGCGKTMILSLLRPDIRIAYWDMGKKDEYPIKENLRNFVSAGINLTRSHISDLAQVTLGAGEDQDLRELPLYFADFFNYLVVSDLIKTIEKMGGRPDVFDSLVDPSKIDNFAALFSEQDCWFNFLDGVTTLPSLKARIRERIMYYRKWINGNISSKDAFAQISQSKTNIGEPIARAAVCLRKCGVLPADVPVLIRVDQIEEMHRAFNIRQKSLLLEFRKMLNRAFASRDARVHYRAGTRRYGYDNPEYMAIRGSDARLEIRRDYHLIEMDEELFVMHERKNSIFQNFAIDAFQKRVAFYLGEEDKELPPDFVKSVFGKSPGPKGRLSQLSSDLTASQIDRALGVSIASEKGQWDDEWKKYLRKLFRNGYEGMLDATLAAAWGRQTGGQGKSKQHREDPPPSNPEEVAWISKQWWRKERLNQAVLQLSTRCQQRYMWWGFRDICSLSGGNITVFLHICHRIWDGFLKKQSSLPEERRINLLRGDSIEPSIQDAAILFASNEWFKKLIEEPGGNSRQSFIEQLGIYLYNSMTGDLRMSYPGGNGVSISIKDLESDHPDIKALKNFLREAVGYGALIERVHTSKSKKGERRLKYYLNPILCPRFSLPEARTKEPYYWSVDKLAEIALKGNITVDRGKVPIVDNNKDTQDYLPGFEGGIK